MKTKMKKRQAELENVKVPIYNSSSKRRIWNPKNWKIVKSYDNYSCEKSETFETSSTYPGWRVIAGIKATVALWSNMLYYMLLSNLIFGPVGIIVYF